MQLMSYASPILAMGHSEETDKIALPECDGARDFHFAQDQLWFAPPELIYEIHAPIISNLLSPLRGGV
jgi:hypothetical protein